MVEATGIGPSPFRLRSAIGVFSRVMFGGIEVTGEDNIDRVPQGRNIIIATTHITDFDVPLTARVLSSKINLAVVDISEHRKFRSDPLVYLGITIAGWNSFLPIDFHRDKKTGEWRPSGFNPDNFTQMEKAMGLGKAILISAHNPITAAQHIGVLPDRGGFGAVYLAAKTNALILPVAVDLQIRGEEGMAGLRAVIAAVRNRPNAKVIIGEPIDIVGVTPERLMRTLAQLLPLEKRGKWG